MNSSFSGFDLTTHLKIVMVAAVTAATVLLVGETAQFERTASAATAPVTAQPLLQPTPQPFWRALPSRKPLMPAAKPQKSPSYLIA